MPTFIAAGCMAFVLSMGFTGVAASAQIDCDGLSYNELITNGCDIPGDSVSTTGNDPDLPADDGTSVNQNDVDSSAPSGSFPLVVAVGGLTAGGALLHISARRVRAAPLAIVADDVQLS